MSTKPDDVRVMIKETHELTALEKHVAFFSSTNSKGHCFFSPATVGDGLNKMHSACPYAKGQAIARFNSAHEGNYWPSATTEFIPDEKAGFAATLHLGTMRMWKPDGTVDEVRWQKLVDFIAATQGPEPTFMKQSTLTSYLNKCRNEDPQESNTGRNTNSWFSSESVQTSAATAAWGEAFADLVGGWDGDEPYVNLDVVRLFFVDSRAAFQKTVVGELPVAKPAVVERGAASISCTG